MKKGDNILVSGVKPTGRPHIGNYFGAMRQFLDLQNTCRSHIFIADLHALTTTHDRETLRQDIVNVALDYLAIGLNPEHAIIFKQSDVPQVAELAWIFNCITTMPYLMRAHAFKDASAQNKEINVGVFDYPILMAADILIHDADIVPVGKDQKQHVEIARDTAEKFNRLFGETFSLPRPYILEEVETVPGIDGRKMSKSYDNTIPLFAEDEEIEKAVMSITTDSKGVDEPKDPNTSTLYAIHKLFLDENGRQELRSRYEKGGAGYSELKNELTNEIKLFIRPLREARKTFAENTDFIKSILDHGGTIARNQAEKKMTIVRDRIGLTL